VAVKLFAPESGKIGKIFDDWERSTQMRATIALLIWLLPSAAFAQTKIALLIGNQTYDASVGMLKNSHNDIAIVGEALRAQNFDVLPPIKDASRNTILGGVRELVRRLNEAHGGAIGFVYYSGHGAAEKGTNINYLIPVNAKQPGTDAFWDDSLKLDDVLRLLDGARSAAKFVVFDACRNELRLPTKDTSKGLLPVAEQEGLFVAYASSPGRTATDRGDKSGVYAAALAAELQRPGLDHLNLFQNVKEAVLTSTAGVQQPWESNGLSRRVYLTEQPKLPDGRGSRLAEAAEAWDRVKDTKDLSVLEAFAQRYKDALYAELARSRIEALKHQRVAVVMPPPGTGSEIAPSMLRPMPYSGMSAEGLFTKAHDEHVKSLSKKHQLPLPDFQIDMPEANLPANLQRFVGIWIGDARQNNNKRSVILVATRVQKDGKLDGYWSWGPPKPGMRFTFDAGFWVISGTITDDTFRFKSWDGNGAFRFTAIPGNKMDYVHSNSKTGVTDAQILEPVWTLVQAERSAKAEPSASPAVPRPTEQPATQVPSQLGQFDGVWYLDRASNNCGAKSWRLPINVQHGVVAGVMAAGAVTGTISEAGQFALKHPGMTAGQPDGSTLHYKGSLQQSSGSGTFYQNPNCNGTFTLIRQ